MLRKLQFDMHVCKNDAVLGTTFPPKAQHDAVFGTTFLPKAQHDVILGTKFSTLDRPILSFFFGFLFVNNFNINKWVGSFKPIVHFPMLILLKKWVWLAN